MKKLLIILKYILIAFARIIPLSLVYLYFFEFQTKSYFLGVINCLLMSPIFSKMTRELKEYKKNKTFIN